VGTGSGRGASWSRACAGVGEADDGGNRKRDGLAAAGLAAASTSRPASESGRVAVWIGKGRRCRPAERTDDRSRHVQDVSQRPRNGCRAGGEVDRDAASSLCALLLLWRRRRWRHGGAATTGLRRDAPAEGEVVVIWIPSEFGWPLSMAVRSMERIVRPEALHSTHVAGVATMQLQG